MEYERVEPAALGWLSCQISPGEQPRAELEARGSPDWAPVRANGEFPGLRVEAEFGARRLQGRVGSPHGAPPNTLLRQLAWAGSVPMQRVRSHLESWPYCLILIRD